MRTARTLIIASLGSAALVAANALPAPFDLLGQQPAFAKNGGGGGGNGNSGGNGNGGSNGNGNGGSNGNGGGNGGGYGSSASASASSGDGHGNSANAPGHNKPGAPTTAAASANGPVAAGKAAHAPGLDREIARLHMVNADLQGFLHASPNSPLGKLLIYGGTLVGAEGAAAARDDARAAFDDAATALNDATDAYNASTMVLTDTYGYADTSNEALQAQKDALLALDTSGFDADQLEAYNAELAAIDQALADGAALDEAQMAYDDADQALMDAEQALADAEAAASDALMAAAKGAPVSDEVKAYVDAGLEDAGVLDHFRNQVPDVEVQ